MIGDNSVAIIGYWFATNYGGVASYYSLYKKIEEMGYAPFLVENPYLESDREGLDTFPRKFFGSIGASISECFDNSNLQELNKLADIFVLGSDQVLTSSSIRAFGKLFLMEFSNEKKNKIAFSSSCGGDNLKSNPEVVNYAKRCLEKFNSISVREFSAIDILREKFDLVVDVVLDPIFFTPKEKYKELGTLYSAEKQEPYLLSYILDPTEDKKEGILKLSKQLNLNSKIVLDGRKFTHEKNRALINMDNDVLPELDFEQWLYYFSDADFIFTDSFHGAAMAIIMNKPFIMYANHGRGYPRFVTLAKMFDLGNRLIQKTSDINDMLISENIDYEKINSILNEKITFAENWLRASLKERHILKKASKTIEKKEIENLHNNVDFVKIRLLATLLRDYGIKHIVLSPGGRDVPLVRMFEHNEEEFILHRVTDERSAAYYGLGIAAQLQQPVACVCTSGTAVSNYLPAVTEAFYTGVPLIVITADRREVYHHHGEDQTITQKNIFGDVVKKFISLPEAGGYLAEYQTRRDISECILETMHNGKGPVHINITIDNIAMGANISKFGWKILPRIGQHILRVNPNDGDATMMRWVRELNKSTKILIVYGQNAKLTLNERQVVERFASKYNCVILTDHISNLNCAYSLKPHNMLLNISQSEFNDQLSPDILITVGGKRLMNDPLTYKVRHGLRNIRHWSVVPDGKVKDFYFRLTSVLEMSQNYFFEWFGNHAGENINNGVYFDKWKQAIEKHKTPIIENFNSLYIQSKFLPQIPENSILHLGVGQTFIESRRFNINKDVEVFCNMGTNGIDGCTSTFMGQCIVARDKMCFLLVGDLSFFYDMNSIWNKPLHKNMRILMVNNNGSGLLRGNNLKAISSVHNTSAKGWVESTGFEYLTANSKETFEEKLKYFLSMNIEKPLFFEVFCE